MSGGGRRPIGQIVTRKIVHATKPYQQKPTGRKRDDLIRVFEAIVWVLTSGARWEDIDKKKYASYQTCHRYFQEWVRSGVFHNALLVL